MMTLRKALILSIDSLREARHKWAVTASMARFDFPEGIRAQAHYDEYTAAVEILQDLLTGSLKMGDPGAKGEKTG